MPDRKMPLLDIRAELKDAVRLIRQGVRLTGARLFEPEAGPPRLGLGPPLRRSAGEMARAADRLAARAEAGVKSLLFPGSLPDLPPIHPETVRAVLQGQSSATLTQAFVRHMRRWLKAALALSGQSHAVVLEQPIRAAFAALPQAAGEDALTLRSARLMQHFSRATPVRLSTLRRAPQDRQDAADRAAAVVLASLCAAGSHQGRAPLDAMRLLSAAHALMPEPLDQAGLETLALRFEELAALL
jgi:hypothetical protein